MDLNNSCVEVMDVRLSVIVVCYNNPVEVRRTLSSIRADFNHDDQNTIDVLVIDGSCSSSISCLVDEYNNVFSVTLVSEPDHGIYDAMNKGLRLARGKHIIYMNSGDSFHVGGLVAFLSQLRDPAVLYYGDAEFYQEGALSFGFKANMQRASDFLRHNCFSHQAIFYPTALLQSLGGYRLDFTISADFDLTWRCWLSGCRFMSVEVVIADCALGGISCLRGLQSYADRVASFQASGAWYYAMLLKVYYPIFLIKNRLVQRLEGSRLLAIYRKYKVK